MELPTLSHLIGLFAALYLIGRVGDFFSRLHVRLDKWSKA